MTIFDSEKKAWIAFSAFPQIGPSRFNLLIQNFGSARRAWEAPSQEYRQLGFNPLLLERFVRFRSTFNLENYIERLKTLEVKVVTREDSEYPGILKTISDAPILLYAKGATKDISSLAQTAIAVVGSRNATSYGREVTERLVTGLVDAGVTIVSGLALGIDAVAHKVALEAGGRTIGVIASGIDEITPRSNQLLAKQMIESGRGLILTESPLGHRPFRQSFPVRNRIVSGLSAGVLVIEGTEKSGTLLTAASAAQQGRDVFAVPGPIISHTSRASHILIREGAKLVENAEDILEELNLKEKRQVSTARRILAETPEEKKILDILSQEPLDIDSLVRISSLDAGKLLGILTTMELKGMVKNIGGIYTKNE